MTINVPWGLLSDLARIAIVPIGVWLAKKIHDGDVRAAILHAADSALVLAIQKGKGNGYKNIAELVQIVVQGMLEDPAAPNILKKNPELAAGAARAAIARNSVGVVSLTGQQAGPQ